MSFLYRYSWDHEDLISYPWSHHYLQGPEILAYLQHIVKKYDLRKHFQFKTELLNAQWKEEEHRWVVTLSTKEVLKVKYLVTALGLLSKTNFPAFPGLDKFAGELYHTARWPQGADLQGKRVGVIGNGSTGVQLITALAKAEEVKQLLSFQRNPQYSVPAGNGPVSTQHRKHLNETYDQVWDQAKNSLFAYGFDEELNRPVASVSPEERERIFEEAWQQGNGFRFMFWTFSDVTVNEEANIAASDFIKNKIRRRQALRARCNYLRYGVRCCGRELYTHCHTRTKRRDIERPLVHDGADIVPWLLSAQFSQPLYDHWSQRPAL
jgi:cyclohexanone monooxygenase